MLSRDLKAYLDSKYDEMVGLLERLVNIDSGSACKEGIDKVASIMAEEYEKEGFQVEILEHENCGNGVIARKAGTGGKAEAGGWSGGNGEVEDEVQTGENGKVEDEVQAGGNGKVLMICHLDTAFPEGAAKANPFTVNGNIATGPGVIDMKACLVGCLYAFKALYALGVKGGSDERRRGSRKPCGTGTDRGRGQEGGLVYRNRGRQGEWRHCD